MYRTNIRHDCPWKLHQVQDAGNHLRQAILQIEKIDKETIFKYLNFIFLFFFKYVALSIYIFVDLYSSSEEVLHILRNLLGCLQRGRTSLIVPRKRTIDDLIKSRNMVSSPTGVKNSTFIEIAKPMVTFVSEVFDAQLTRRFGN